MTIRQYTTADHPTLATWWQSHGWQPVPDHRLPQTSYLIEDIDDAKTPRAFACAYLDCQGTGVAMLEWILTNPDNKPRQSIKSLNTLIPFLRDLLVNEFDYDCILSTCAHPALSRLMEKHQFTVTDRGVIHHVHAAQLHHAIRD